MPIASAPLMATPASRHELRPVPQTGKSAAGPSMVVAALGRTPHESWFGDVASTKGEAEYALKHLKKWMKPTKTRVPLEVLPGKAAYRYEPLGTVVVIGPWNYPFYLTLSPMIGALAAGNTVVVKPSEHAPATSAALARLLPIYLDPEAVTVIVTKNADLDVAARRIAFGKLLNSGQTCVAPDYLLVDKSIREEFVTKLKATITEFRAGEPAAQKIVNDRQFGRLAGMLEGQDIVAGGNPDAAAATMEPTIVLNPDRNSSLMQGEIFGPILPIIDVNSLDEAISFINDGEKPLAAYIFSRSKAEQMRVIEEVPAGGVVANHIAMQVLTPQLPFGGVGHSGMGAYHGKWGYEAFSHRKATLRMPSRPDLKMIYPPYSERDKKLLRKLA